MSVLSHIAQDLYDALDDVNRDIDALVEVRDRIKAAVIALQPTAPAGPVELGSTVLVSPARPDPRRAAEPRHPGQSKYDYDKVSRVAAEAYSNGQPMGKAVADAFGTSIANAGQLIIQARERGHAIPRRGDRTRPATPAALELAAPPAHTVEHPSTGMTRSDEHAA